CILKDVVVFPSLQKLPISVVQSGKGKKLGRFRPQRYVALFCQLLEDRNLIERSKRCGRDFVALVIENVERLRGFYYIFIEVRKHLLDPFFIFIGKEEYRNRVIPNVWI